MSKEDDEHSVSDPSYWGLDIPGYSDLKHLRKSRRSVPAESSSEKPVYGCSRCDWLADPDLELWQILSQREFTTHNQEQHKSNATLVKKPPIPK